jgi:hypothetical protein
LRRFCGRYEEKTKMNPMNKKISFSLLLAVVMTPVWFVIILLIDHASSNEMFQYSLLERTPPAYLYFWVGEILPNGSHNFEARELLNLIGNTLFYFGLSYGLLSLFGSDKINTKKMLSVVIGFLMNPILIFILDKTDWHVATWHVTSNYIQSITMLNRTLPAYMFNWSSLILPFQISLRAELLLALICNAILYFLLSYGFLNLFFQSKILKPI